LPSNYVAPSPSPTIPHVYVGMPCHDSMHIGPARSFYRGSSRRAMKQTICPLPSSLLAHACNILWCAALNRRKTDGVTHFAMLHADIDPAPWWLDTLLDELDRTGADLVSVVVPIKDERGLTSTALDLPAEHDPEQGGWPAERRLTMSEIMELPETFGPEDLGCPPGFALLVNTGCFVCRLDRPWCSEVHFEIRNRIVVDDDGMFWPQCEPEDWGLSRQIARLGGKVVATRKVAVGHIGRKEYRNDSAWGEWVEDQGCPMAIKEGEG